MLIGEVARRSGVSARMLRHYESLGLVRPTGRSGSGYREYSTEDIQRIFHIESLRSLGLSLRDVGRALDDPGFRPAALVDDLIRQSEERIAAETELLSRLRGVGAAEPTDWTDVLRIVALLQALGSDSAGRRQRAALASVDAAPPAEALADAVLREADPNVAGALRWALAQSGGAGLDRLADGLRSPDADVRTRALQAIGELRDDAATALLHEALAGPDLALRRRAALALGNRGVADAVPTLIDMVVDDVNDADATDALTSIAIGGSEVGGHVDVADQIATRLAERLESTVDQRARLRLTQALADIPGDSASGALATLTGDPDRAVALTATYVVSLRENR